MVCAAHPCNRFTRMFIIVRTTLSFMRLFIVCDSLCEVLPFSCNQPIIVYKVSTHIHSFIRSLDVKT